MSRCRFTRRLALSLACVAACRADQRQAPPPPDFAAVIAAGDSSFLLERTSGALTLRRSPLLITRLDDRFHEVYLVDEDLSFHDAVLIGQRVYRRDLLTGDSVLVRYDSTVRQVAMRWARQHPGDRPLLPDEDTAEEPTAQVTSDTQLLDVVGPFLSLEFQLDVDAPGEAHRHQSVRAVVDLRDGSLVRLAHLTTPAETQRVLQVALQRLNVASDSIRDARDARAARARSLVGGFALDATSFELIDSYPRPSVSFLVPGRGARAAGYSLPLADIEFEPIGFGSDWRETRPTAGDSASFTWNFPDWSLQAMADSIGVAANLTVSNHVGFWSVGPVPLPVRRVFAVPAADTIWRGAVRRAFDDVVQWQGDGRVARLPTRPAPIPASRVRRHYTPYSHRS